MIENNIDNTFEYEERIVAFIDILGFKALIDSTNTADAQANSDNIRKMIDIYTEIENSLNENLQKNDGILDDLKITRFSDCIVISFPEKQIDALFFLCISLLHFLYEMLVKYNLVFRGGITSGKLIHDDQYLFGPAMNRAYELESNFAIYPRIIVDEIVLNNRTKWLQEIKTQLMQEPNAQNQFLFESLINELEHFDLSNSKNCILSIDTDNFLYIDYLTKIDTEFDDPEYDFPLYLNSVNDIISNNLNSRSTSVIQKYQWMLNKIQPILEHFNSRSSH
ncbi:hypothetical protein [Acinetobacter pittii]|uniref:hypothetical protein n=1 Tax=Acinetobacter pittii TaxID=48296 RepID=UPI0008384DA2|nr:hypothetical protein [Acinetobacter pittii]OCY53088.1 hypothetical protein BFR81_06310 [Acinetobacter pittii]